MKRFLRKQLPAFLLVLVMLVGMVPAAAGVRAQNAGGARTSNFNQNNRITIHAPGGDPRAVQQGVQRGISQSNKVNPAQSGTVPKG